MWRVLQFSHTYQRGIYIYISKYSYILYTNYSLHVVTNEVTRKETRQSTQGGVLWWHLNVTLGRLGHIARSNAAKMFSKEMCTIFSSPLWLGDDSVHHGARWRVGQALLALVKHSAVDPLLHNHHCQLGTDIIGINQRKTIRMSET